MMESAEEVANRQPSVTWDDTVGALAGAHSYWVCTVGEGSRPHSAPVWGVWWNGCLVFSTPSSTVKAHNLGRRPAVGVHLESADDVVMLDGTAYEMTDTGELDAVSAAFTAKYGSATGVTYDLAAARNAGMAVFAVRAQVVRAWASGEFFRPARWVIDDHGRRRATVAFSAADLAGTE